MVRGEKVVKQNGMILVVLSSDSIFIESTSFIRASLVGKKIGNCCSSFIGCMRFGKCDKSQWSQKMYIVVNKINKFWAVSFLGVQD